MWSWIEKLRDDFWFWLSVVITEEQDNSLSDAEESFDDWSFDDTPPQYEEEYLDCDDNPNCQNDLYQNEYFGDDCDTHDF